MAWPRIYNEFFTGKKPPFSPVYRCPRRKGYSIHEPQRQWRDGNHRVAYLDGTQLRATCAHCHVNIVRTNKLSHWWEPEERP